jgi:hypothetical protein
MKADKHKTNKRYVHQLDIFGLDKSNKKNYSGTLFF